MAIKGVDPKCYILALFVREDGERFLLGSGRYVFKEKQQHFQANKMANDVIEVQGNDGYLLAGQVRRPGTQDFDGYVGDGTSSKEQVEQWRRDFFKFFRKNYLYKVIYVFSDGSAIQRKRGFLVDAPTVEELYQIYPEYHVALNFEDINYYFYNEDSDGNEIYGKSAIIGLSVGATGGLMWDNLGAISLPYSWINPVSVSGTDIQINNQLSDEVPITDLQLAGDTLQQTYSGYNLINLVPMTNTQPTRSQQCSIETVMDTTLGRNVLHITGTNNYPSVVYQLPQRLESGKYYALKLTYRSAFTGTASKLMWFAPNWSGNDWDVLGSMNTARCKSGDGDTSQAVNESTTWKTTSRRFYVDPSQYTSDTASYKSICFSLGYNQNSTKEVWLADAEVYEITEAEWNANSYASKDYEKFVGGTASPNPSFPQAINVVTGEQTVQVTGKNLVAGSQDFGGTGWYNSSGWTTDSNTYNGLTVKKKASAWNGIYREIPVENGATYTFSVYAKADAARQAIFYASALSGSVSPTQKVVNITTDWQRFDYTFTVTSADTVVRCRLEASSTLETYLYVCGTQLEKSASMTDYEPYQGTTKTVDLGSTELAKIGTYQDYIYKSGDDWYVHKAVGKVVLDGSETWGVFPSMNRVCFYTNIANGIGNVGYSNNYGFRTDPSTGGYPALGSIFYNGDGNKNMLFRQNDDNTITTVNAYKTWLSTHNTTVYYPLATPTDTKITDSTLIGELDGLEGTKLFIGENNVLVTANGSNLPATLSFKYYTGVNYDGAGFEWEPGGSGGDDMITVDSIDDVYPMLTIPGPVVNPTITNVTTGSVFQYTGTLSSTQKLEVDLMAKTAFLNGVSVIANVTSSSLYFKSGVNRVNYTTNNADAPNATIKWQEIVG